VIGLSSLLRVNEIWSTVQGRILNCPSCRKYKHTPISGDAKCRGQYGLKLVTPLKILETQRGSFHILSPNISGQSAAADEKARDMDSR
jgi:hypothetical protein